MRRLAFSYYFPHLCRHFSSSSSFPRFHYCCSVQSGTLLCLSFPALESTIQCLHLVCIPIDPCHIPRLHQLDRLSQKPWCRTFGFSVWYMFIRRLSSLLDVVKST